MKELEQTASHPGRCVLSGAFVRVEPLEPDRHATALFDALGGAGHDALWTFMSDGPWPAREDFHAALVARAASSDPLFYALVDPRTGRAEGYAALMRIDRANRVIEIGHVMFGPALRRTAAASEVFFLLAGLVFDRLGYRRLEWKCNDRNEASKRAALRFGFRFEGVFRQHMIVKGANRDTAWFSMLDREWPARREALARWLSPGNIGPDGRQRAALARAP